MFRTGQSPERAGLEGPESPVPAPAPTTTPAAGILALHRSAGNQAVSGAFGPTAAAPTTPAPGTGDRAKDYEIDEARAHEDLKAAYQRLTEIPALDNPEFKGLLAWYVESAVEAQETHDGSQAGAALEKVLEYMDSQRMFEISRQKYRNMVKNGTATDDGIASAARESAEKGFLWSKLNKFYSIDEVKSRGGAGLSLEASVGGSLFDGLSFGLGRDNLIGKKQWDDVSRTYVKHLTGDVHAAAFQGIHPTSVFTRVEWPEISKRLGKEVHSLVVHVFDADQRGTIIEKRQEVIHSPGEFDQLRAQGDLAVQRAAATGEEAEGVGLKSIKWNPAWQDHQNKVQANEEKGSLARGGVLRQMNQIEDARRLNGPEPEEGVYEDSLGTENKAAMAGQNMVREMKEVNKPRRGLEPEAGVHQEEIGPDVLRRAKAHEGHRNLMAEMKRARKTRDRILSSDPANAKYREPDQGTHDQAIGPDILAIINAFRQMRGRFVADEGSKD